MRERRVNIVFINSAYAAREGYMKKDVPLSYAMRMADLGVARIIEPVSTANVGGKAVKPERNLVEDYIYGVDDIQDDLTKISYIGRGLSENIEKVGLACGYKVWNVSPRNYCIDSLILSRGIILSSDIGGFESSERNQIKAMLFQKSKPFVFRAVDLGRNLNWVRHCFERSVLNLFANEEVFDAYIEVFEDSIENYYIEDTDNYYETWRMIGEGIDQCPA